MARKFEEDARASARSVEPEDAPVRIAQWTGAVAALFDHSANRTRRTPRAANVASRERLRSVEWGATPRRASTVSWGLPRYRPCEACTRVRRCMLSWT